MGVLTLGRAGNPVTQEKGKTCGRAVRFAGDATPAISCQNARMPREGWRRRALLKSRITDPLAEVCPCARFHPGQLLLHSRIGPCHEARPFLTRAGALPAGAEVPARIMSLAAPRTAGRTKAEKSPSGFAERENRMTQQRQPL